MPKCPWVEFPLVLLMLGAPGIILWKRMSNRPKDDTSPRGLGVRLIQTIALMLVIPAVIILALEDKLSNEGVGTILGVIVGYSLGGVLKGVPSKNKDRAPK